jgi:hypothetical protein
VVNAGSGSDINAMRMNLPLAVAYERAALVIKHHARDTTLRGTALRQVFLWALHFVTVPIITQGEHHAHRGGAKDRSATCAAAV